MRRDPATQPSRAATGPPPPYDQRADPRRQPVDDGGTAGWRSVRRARRAATVCRIVVGSVGAAGRHRGAACAGHVGRRRPVPDGRPGRLCRRRPAPDGRHPVRLLLRAAAPAVHLSDVLGDHLHPDDLAAVDRAAGPLAAGLLRRHRADGLLRRCGCSGRAGPQAPQPLQHVRGIVVTTTALGLWLEPVRTTFNYGQINLFLCALLLAGAVAGKEWLAGASVGIAAGVKLTPAITGLYYLLQKRWSAVIWSIVFFAGTVGYRAGAAAGRDLAVLHQADVRSRPHRPGVVGDQPVAAWRDRPDRRCRPDDRCGSSSRSLRPCSGCGRPGSACARDDRTGGLLAVQFTGLLISPISWSHHWVWVLPLLLWCLFGPHQRLISVRVLAIAWLVGTLSYIVSILIAMQYIGPTGLPALVAGLARVDLPGARRADPGACWRWSTCGSEGTHRCSVGRAWWHREPNQISPDRVAQRRRRLLGDTGVRCAGLRAGHEVLDRRT